MDVNQILKLRHSPIRNYVIPGLTSWLIGGKSEAGTIRLFEMTRHPHEPITPHSHRFDLYSYVLAGEVTNVLWKVSQTDESFTDNYRESLHSYNGDCGKYEVATNGGATPWMNHERVYKQGNSYFMEANEVHSIRFQKGALLLIFEGPQVSPTSTIPNGGGGFWPLAIVLVIALAALLTWLTK